MDAVSVFKYIIGQFGLLLCNRVFIIIVFVVPALFAVFPIGGQQAQPGKSQKISSFQALHLRLAVKRFQCIDGIFVLRINFQ
jgi:hypothetical protein